MTKKKKDNPIRDAAKLKKNLETIAKLQAEIKKNESLIEVREQLVLALEEQRIVLTRMKEMTKLHQEDTDEFRQYARRSSELEAFINYKNVILACNR